MELRKEYEAIRSRAIQGLCVPANQVTVGNVIDAVREAVTACQELADRPPKELTNDEVDSTFDDMPSGAAGFCREWGYRQFASAIIAAFIAKQREPQVVKFRAAMNKESGAIEMLRDGNSLPTAWCFLEPAQEFEVRI